jgi:16S rRNA C1402 (ribose-2'-O) methylase RsmI
LDILIQYIPNIQMSICREMTKQFQQIIRGTPSQCKQQVNKYTYECFQFFSLFIVVELTLSTR